MDASSFVVMVTHPSTVPMLCRSQCEDGGDDDDDDDDDGNECGGDSDEYDVANNDSN